MIMSRKKLSLGFGAFSAVMAVTSLAYGCTVWVGKITVAPTAGGTATGTAVTAYGAGTGMNHCWIDGGKVNAHVQEHSGAAANGSQITITYNTLDPATDPTACSTVATKTPASGEYNISYLNTGLGDFVGTGSGRTFVHDCMTSGGHVSTWWDGRDNTAPITHSYNNILTVTSGMGSAMVTIARKPTWHPTGQSEIKDLPGTESAICLQQKPGSYTGTPHGAQAPFTVI